MSFPYLTSVGNISPMRTLRIEMYPNEWLKKINMTHTTGNQFRVT